MGNTLKHLPIITTGALVAILLILIWLGFSPGFMSYDSMVQYKSALENQYTDSHPPIMSYLWHLVIKIVDGPQSFLLVHLLTLALGIVVWASNIPRRFTSVLIPLVFFMPWIANFSGVLWKDVGLAYSLLLGTGLIFHKKTGWLMIGLAAPFLFYATAVRHNAILAVVPILFFAIQHHFPALSKLKTIPLVLLVSVTILMASSTMSYKVIGAERKNFETFLMGDDIVKISSSIDKELLPGVRAADISFCSVHPIHYERALCFISKGYDPSGSLVVGMNPKYIHSLWLETIIENPIVYVRMKVEAFMYFLRSPSLLPYQAWHDGIMQNDLGIELFYPRIKNIFEAYINQAQNHFAFMFKPYTWLILCFVMLLLSVKLKPGTEKTQIQALNFSALGYFVSLFISVPSADFRYIYWCIIASSISLVLYIANGSTKKNESINEK